MLYSVTISSLRTVLFGRCAAGHSAGDGKEHEDEQDGRHAGVRLRAVRLHEEGKHLLFLRLFKAKPPNLGGFIVSAGRPLFCRAYLGWYLQERSGGFAAGSELCEVEVLMHLLLLCCCDEICCTPSCMLLQEVIKLMWDGLWYIRQTAGMHLGDLVSACHIADVYGCGCG